MPSVLAKLAEEGFEPIVVIPTRLESDLIDRICAIGKHTGMRNIRLEPLLVDTYRNFRVSTIQDIAEARSTVAAITERYAEWCVSWAPWARIASLAVQSHNQRHIGVAYGDWLWASEGHAYRSRGLRDLRYTSVPDGNAPARAWLECSSCSYNAACAGPELGSYHILASRGEYEAAVRVAKLDCQLRLDFLPSVIEALMEEVSSVVTNQDQGHVKLAVTEDKGVKISGSRG